MAEEVRGTVSGGNGERLDLRIGGQSLGFTTKDLVNVLIVILLGGFGYFLAYNVTANQQRGFDALAKVMEQNSTNQSQVIEKLATNQAILIDHVQVNRENMRQEVRQQNVLLNEQTQALQVLVDSQTKEIRRMLITLNYNLSHEPQERIPIEFAPEEMRHQTPSGR